jgi:hypothetical protein
MMMKTSKLLVALSAVSLASGVAFAQTYNQQQPATGATGAKPEATKPAMPSDTSAGFSLSQLDKNNDGAVDKQEARSSATLSEIFDKADTNKDGKLDSGELSAASSMPKSK